jgi:FAD:protein FMN transferase
MPPAGSRTGALTAVPPSPSEVAEATDSLLGPGPSRPASSTFRALGTTVSVLTVDHRALAEAESELRSQLEQLDDACSRFRPGSELSAVHQAGGAPVPISPLLAQLVSAAIEVANLTGGAVDPTVGAAVSALGYDRDFAALDPNAPPLAYPPVPAPGWRCIELDRERLVLAVPAGAQLDLGSSAKAFAADRAASTIAARLGTGVLVNLGGDIAVGGPPPEGGWPVGLARASTTAPAATDVVVAIQSGGLASSGTAVRTWRRGHRVLHHIVDPRTGDSADSPWALASVVAGTCLTANAASTAAIVVGEGAIELLAGLGLPARLVRGDGTVLCVGGWPA